MTSEVDNGSGSSPQPQDGSRNASLKREENANEDQSNSEQSGDEDMASSKSKDPSRPKRKKARRACSPCQRAHLTCTSSNPLVAPVTTHQATFGPIMQYQQHSSMSSEYGQPTGLPNPGQEGQTAASPAPLNVSGYTQQPMFNPNDPSNLANFDLNSMNFGNHYGAAEFDMLGQMSTGVYDGNGQLPSSDAGSFARQGLSSNQGNYGFSADGSLAGWQPQHGGQAMPYPAYDTFSEPYRRRTQSGAYNINNSSFSAASPTSADTEVLRHRESAFDRRYPTNHYPINDQVPQVKQEQPIDTMDPKPSEAISEKLQAARVPPRPQRLDLSYIYTEIRHPYPYTAAFHRLFAGIERRFSMRRRLRIAQALASFRPSFISSTKDLAVPDLVFAEQSFQVGVRLLAVDSELNGGPTVICRRTGEVVHANSEFTLMSGWEKDILIGRKKNHNINQHAPDEGISSMNNSGRAGLDTPRLLPEPAAINNLQKEASADGRPRHQKHQPIVLPDLMDNESAVRFYEDYAQLAFADRGSVTRRCQLLLYKMEDGHIGSGRKRKEYLDGSGRDEADETGKVDCMYCLLIKRDVWSMPSAMVINVSLSLPIWL
ncbi:MAG: Transcriptional regulator of nonfermentable carbon utilization [Chrysothrix sp. TS-e1954]|nr:MAG: Transcriptional regulator of nonfermentable carbon utilization [Chrysothrix sp. TS-e1954]